jgi:hypothetical protein
MAVDSLVGLDDFGSLVELAVQRILVSDEVAATKFRSGAPVEDLLRERQVLAEAGRRAAQIQAAADVPRNRVIGLPGCLQEGLRDGMPLDGGARHERAANTAQRGIATLGMFAAFEGWQQVVESPALRTGRGPRVVAGLMPARTKFIALMDEDPPSPRQRGQATYVPLTC